MDYMPMIKKNFNAIEQHLNDMRSELSKVQKENENLKQQLAMNAIEINQLKQEIAYLKATNNNFIPVQ
jgi:archaellum component FlaC